MRKLAVILYGAPGSGKGTQANLLARKLNVVHFDMGGFLESIVHDPKRQKEKLVQRERKLFDSGKLMTTSFVLREITEQVRKISTAGLGLILSGNPRTLREAKGLIPVLEKLYGQRNIFCFILKTPSRSSLRRNSARLICRFCGAALLTAFYPSKNPKRCPVCGGPLYKRSLDNPQIIKVRLREYEERTKPIFEMLKKRGYKVNVVDGRPAPYKVSYRIEKTIARKAR